MSSPYILSGDETVADRDFTAPHHSHNDLNTLRHMAQQLVDTYDDPAVCNFVPGKRAICMSDPQGRHFRIYYIRPDLLFSSQNLTVVGFFGQKRKNADVRPLIKADKRFEEEFHKHPGLLSLSTVRLPDGDFANLVLFTDPDAKDNWNFSQIHYETVSEISPPYYKSIRLNNALLPDGLDNPGSVRLQAVKYIDYSTMPPWRGFRSHSD